MNTASPPMPANAAHAVRPRPFVIDLLSLVARVFATAIAINIVFAAVVLLLASPASAKAPDSPAARAVPASPEHAQRCNAAPAARDLTLVMLHRLGSGAMPLQP